MSQPAASCRSFPVARSEECVRTATTATQTCGSDIPVSRPRSATRRTRSTTTQTCSLVAATPGEARQGARLRSHRIRLQPRVLSLVLLPQRAVRAVVSGVCAVGLAPLRVAVGQRVPYSGRKHLVLMPETVMRALGAAYFSVV